MTLLLFSADYTHSVQATPNHVGVYEATTATR